ncbi:MAG: hypothetical protein LQ344_000443 [Seirophora lacunosa]|nr:MAG: hypothetical protein LQ344_000443 [Seirophora lacunosa]
MKFSVFLAAALSLETILAFPFVGPEPVDGKMLIARVGKGSNHGSSHQSTKQSSKAKEQIGYSGSHRNENAPAGDRAKVQKVVDRAPDIRGVKIPVRNEGDPPPEGETAVYTDHNRHGNPRTNILMGRMGGKPTEHSYIKYGTEKAFPRSREAEYRLKSSEEHGKTRYRAGGTLHDTIAPKDTVGDGTVPQGAMKEEKPRFAKFEDKPANDEEAKEQGANDPDNRRVYTARANLDQEMKDSYDPKKTPWLKGPDTTKIGGNPPE